MSRKGLVIVLALGALRDPCGTDTIAAGLNGPCTRTSDCAEPLSCIMGVCTPPDAGVPDAGGEGGRQDAGPPGLADAALSE